MAQKKYRLTPKANPFLKDNDFKFRVGYDKNYGTPPTHIVSQKKAPIITIPKLGVVTTTNLFTQQALETMIVPQKSSRGGQKHPDGNLFDDITGQGQPVDLDLDTVFT